VGDYQRFIERISENPGNEGLASKPSYSDDRLTRRGSRHLITVERRPCYESSRMDGRCEFQFIANTTYCVPYSDHSVASYRLRRSRVKPGRSITFRKHCVRSAAGSAKGSTLMPHVGRPREELAKSRGPNSARTTSRTTG
jgi:hypothetical protein